MSVNPGRTIERPFPQMVESESSPISGKFAECFPFLQEFLEKKRESRNYHTTGSATLFVADGGYRVCLNDRPRERSCFVSGRTLVQLFETANRGLASGQLQWRTKGYKLPK